MSSAAASSFRTQVAARELAGAVRDGEDAGLVLAFALQTVEHAVGPLDHPGLRPLLDHGFLDAAAALTVVGARRARTLAGALQTEFTARGPAGLTALLGTALAGVAAPAVPELDAAVRRLRA